jgi:hypothetical protein
MPTLCFGDISRDEINTVLNIAGVSLAPPKKVFFYFSLLVVTATKKSFFLLTRHFFIDTFCYRYSA